MVKVTKEGFLKRTRESIDLAIIGGTVVTLLYATDRKISLRSGLATIIVVAIQRLCGAPSIRALKVVGLLLVSLLLLTMLHADLLACNIHIALLKLGQIVTGVALFASLDAALVADTTTSVIICLGWATWYSITSIDEFCQSYWAWHKLWHQHLFAFRAFVSISPPGVHGDNYRAISLICLAIGTIIATSLDLSHFFVRLWAIVVICVSVAAVVLSLSRAVWLSAIIGVFIAIWSSTTLRRLYKVMITISLTVGCVAIYLMRYFDATVAASESGRFVLLTLGVSLAVANWRHGVGNDNYLGALSCSHNILGPHLLRQPFNSFVGVMTEGGISAAALVVGIFIITLLMIWRPEFVGMSVPAGSAAALGAVASLLAFACIQYYLWADPAIIMGEAIQFALVANMSVLSGMRVGCV